MTPEEYQEALKAVSRNGCVLERYSEQTEELCLTAVKENGWALKYVKDQTAEICLAAINQGYPLALKYVKDQTPDICLFAVRQNGGALTYVKNQTPEICLAAIKNNALCYIHVNEHILSEEFLENAVRTNWHVLNYIESPSERICLLAYEQDVRALGILWPQYSQKINENYEVIDDFLHELSALATQRELEWILHQAHSNSDVTNTAAARRRRDVF